MLLHNVEGREALELEQVEQVRVIVITSCTHLLFLHNVEGREALEQVSRQRRERIGIQPSVHAQG